MKRLIAFLFTLMLLAAPAFAQEETVSVPKSQLTEQQKAQFATKTVTQQGHEWIGLGKEIGEAFNSALGAVTTNLDAFSRTRVGNWLMFLLVWKIIGAELMRVIIGTGIFLIGTFLLTWSYYKTCMTRSILLKKNPDKSKEYKIINLDSDLDGRRFVHAVLQALLIIITLATMFA